MAQFCVVNVRSLLAPGVPLPVFTVTAPESPDDTRTTTFPAGWYASLTSRVPLAPSLIASALAPTVIAAASSSVTVTVRLLDALSYSLAVSASTVVCVMVTFPLTTLSS